MAKAFEIPCLSPASMELKFQRRIDKASDLNCTLGVRCETLYYSYFFEFVEGRTFFSFVVSSNFQFQCTVTICDCNHVTLCTDTTTSVYDASKSRVSCNLFAAANVRDRFREVLRNLPEDKLVMVCRIISIEKIPKFCEYLKKLSDDLTDLPATEKVYLCIDGETETVNKTILCARSSVFSKMFQNEMMEAERNTVVITDIDMPVLKNMLTFLHSGIIHDTDFDALCDLYYAADKYRVTELQDACNDLLCSMITVRNACHLLMLSDRHNNDQLKKAVSDFFSLHLQELIETDEWYTLVRDQTKLALEMINYLNAVKSVSQ